MSVEEKREWLWLAKADFLEEGHLLPAAFDRLLAGVCVCVCDAGEGAGN